MSGLGRSMSKSFLSTTRTALRACKSNVGEVGKGRSMGSPCVANPAAGRPPVSSAPSPTSFLQTRRPASFFFRLPGEVACVQSLLPLHNATASARLVAQLSTTAGALLQGTLTHMSPDR